MNLKARIDRLEAVRNTGAIEILRMRHDGGGSLTEIRGGRIVSRRELTPEETARLARGAIVIERGYGLTDERSAG